MYETDIGDLAISALSNLLHTPLVLFTSMADHPVHIQYPTSSLLNAHPIYLAYLHIGPGHYDAVIPDDEVHHDNMTSAETISPDITSDCAVNNKTHCTCGRKNMKGSACSFSLQHYSCRCPCYNSQKPCTEYCKCKKCSNTFGARQTVKESSRSQKRKRQSYETQSIPLRGKRAAKFMEDVGEPMMIGGHSKIEYLIVCSIVQTLKGDDWELSQDIDVTEAYKIYRHILELVKLLQIDLALFDRNIDKLQKLLYHKYY